MDPIQLNYNYGFDGHTNSDKLKLSGNQTFACFICSEFSIWLAEKFWFELENFSISKLNDFFRPKITALNSSSNQTFQTFQILDILRS